MIPQLELLDAMDRMTYDFLWAKLSGIGDEELDGRPHPHGNTVRWIVGHLIGYEERYADAIDGVGRYVDEPWPSAVDVDGTDAEARSRLGAAAGSGQRRRRPAAQPSARGGRPWSPRQVAAATGVTACSSRSPVRMR